MNCLVCHVCQKLGAHDQFVPIAASLPLNCDIHSGKECQLDTAQIEVATCEGRSTDEVELNAVTISNVSIDRKSVETDGKRGRYRDITVDSGASESVVSLVNWPNVDLKPSKGLSERQRHVDPGGEKTDSFWET